MKKNCVICGKEFECLGNEHVVCSTGCSLKYAAEQLVIHKPIKKELWEILVPRFNNKGKNIYITHHWKWDKEIRKLAGGLTIFKPTRGHWISPENELFVEQMIPVRIYCTEKDMDKIIKFTLKHYNQKAVMAYVISTKVKLVKK